MSNKNQKIEIRVDAWDKALIRQKATDLNLSMSEYILRTALGRELPAPVDAKQVEAYLLLRQYRLNFMRIKNLLKKGNYSLMIDRIDDLIEKIEKHLNFIENGWKRS
ncbi:plasmid mobilization protein [Ornithobacterium rhinotracheale]|uniref:plasmid mobilization protein n=1 Tax=Ornithobacterium rhinotracheale TaxID=28251 RepID=UPI00129CEAC4|nr:hypothetical protein [Ornithobacterium rhinotracheale]MRJ07905.1 hypothetical protein [Ornithobacterium rhinotracheale]UOH78581.1 hypothetical protein MT996_03710 [Ornithobacterium rhinotracheale]